MCTTSKTIGEEIAIMVERHLYKDNVILEYKVNYLNDVTPTLLRVNNFVVTFVVYSPPVYTEETIKIGDVVIDRIFKKIHLKSSSGVSTTYNLSDTERSRVEEEFEKIRK
jgi:hypothetical protein